jgi:hypothetical protein
MAFRFYLQPLMATFFAVRDGIRAARDERRPYLWALCTEPGHRMALLREAWKSIGKVFVVAVLVDCAYQFIALHHRMHIFDAVVVAATLAIIPYIIIRGPTNRLFRRVRRPPSKNKAA